MAKVESFGQSSAERRYRDWVAVEAAAGETIRAEYKRYNAYPSSLESFVKKCEIGTKRNASKPRLKY